MKREICAPCDAGQAAKHTEGAWRELLSETWHNARYHGCACACVRSWERWSLGQLVTIAACIGGGVLARCFRKLARDYSTWASGMPDLLLWRGSPAVAASDDEEVDAASPRQLEAKFVEVKSQRDAASAKQSEWMTSLQVRASRGVQAGPQHTAYTHHVLTYMYKRLHFRV